MRPRILSALAVVAVAASLAACAPRTPTPTEIPVPEIAWQPSEPSGGFVDDPYGKVVYDANLAFVLANNAHDYSITQLGDSLTTGMIDEYYESYLKQYVTLNADPRAYVGPFPRIVTDVIENTAGDGAEVVVCGASTDWYVSADHPAATSLGDDAVSGSIFVITDPVDGRLKVASTQGTGNACDPGRGMPAGRFVPEPKPVDDIAADQVVAPIGYDER